MEKVTIVLLVSRSEYIEQVLSLIELQDYDLSLINLIAVVDGDNELFVKIIGEMQILRSAMLNKDKILKNRLLFSIQNLNLANYFVRGKKLNRKSIKLFF